MKRTKKLLEEIKKVKSKQARRKIIKNMRKMSRKIVPHPIENSEWWYW